MGAWATHMLGYFPMFRGIYVSVMTMMRMMVVVVNG